MFLLLLIAPKQKNFCVTKDRVPLRGLAAKPAPALFLCAARFCRALDGAGCFAVGRVSTGLFPPKSF